MEILANMWQSLRARLSGVAGLEARRSTFLRSVHQHMDATVQPGAKVFLGDSITYGLILSNVTTGGVKFATGGQNSEALLQEMHGLTCLARASVVVITIGTNDVLEGRVDGLEDRYRQILAAVPAGVPVILSSVPPIEAARRACADDARCTFVDAYGALSEGDAPLPGVLWDGVHLSADGYRIWAGLLRPALR
jgi:hypothetical protein